MNATDALLMTVTMLALAVVPSTSVALVVIRTSVAGFGHGVAVTAGIVLGDLLFAGLALLGMSAVAEVAGGLFVVIKYLAGAYLIWLGIELIRSRQALRVSESSGPASSLAASFVAGLVVTLGDIKALFFYASLFPVFVEPSAVTLSEILLIVAITVCTVGGVKLVFAATAQKLVSMVNGYSALGRTRVTAGGFMIGAGAYVMVKS